MREYPFLFPINPKTSFFFSSKYLYPTDSYVFLSLLCHTKYLLLKNIVSMKKFIYLFWLSIGGALSLSSCSKEEITQGTIVEQGLYTYYKFDGDFNDETENVIDGFGNNSPSFVEGLTEESQAVKFSRTNNSSFIVSKAITDSPTLTVSFWGKDFSDGNIFYLVSSNQNASMFTLTMSQGSLKFVATRYNNEYQYSNRPSFTHPTITDGKWHHIVLVSDFNNIEYATTTTLLYVDGIHVDTITEYVNPFEEETPSQASYGTGIKFVMGGNVTIERKTINGTNMSVDNLRVYNTRCLSANEIKQIYDAQQ